MSLVLGRLLAPINHGDTIVGGTMTAGDWARVALTFLVPYTVPTISAVLALREQERLHDDCNDPVTRVEQDRPGVRHDIVSPKTF
ncbi:MAG: nitrate/nitrite transporter NrtS [Roseitalea sp.]|nr:nitrate/nitrite transporter NrtS [Roseitalea sp.]MBO6721367.1 nitrate/nitrite transporter NrtS [Roseitalea sp.]MBO6744552.1 nitrate/nitrite transporter NrtS [Roseitalea sp.]